MPLSLLKQRDVVHGFAGLAVYGAGYAAATGRVDFSAGGGGCYRLRERIPLLPEVPRREKPDIRMKKSKKAQNRCNSCQNRV